MPKHRRHRAVTLALIISLTLALCLQYLIGDIGTALLHFPINAIAVALLILIGSLCRHYNILSKHSGIIVVVLWLLFSIFIGVIPQGRLSTPSIITKLGLHSLWDSWLYLWLSSWSIISISATLTNNKLSALLFRLGVMLFVIFLSWGRYDNTEGRAIARAIGPDNLITTSDGKGKELPFTYQYLVTDISHHNVATIKLDNITTTISANHPAHHKGYDIYLVTTDRQQPLNPRYAVLLIVKEPWKPIAIAAILMIISGVICHFISKPLNHDK